MEVFPSWALPLFGYCWEVLQDLLSPEGEMGFAKDMLSQECMETSQEFSSYQGIAEEDFTRLPSHPCLTCDAADVPGANSSPAFIPAAICLQTEKLVRSSSLLAAVPLPVFLFRRGFLSF